MIKYIQTNIPTCTYETYQPPDVKIHFKCLKHIKYSNYKINAYMYIHPKSRLKHEKASILLQSIHGHISLRKYNGLHIQCTLYNNNDNGRFLYSANNDYNTDQSYVRYNFNVILWIK